MIDITTRMPEKFEAGGDIRSTWQDYSFYGKKKTFDSQDILWMLVIVTKTCHSVLMSAIWIVTANL